jgi:hypothetical protein
MSIRRHPARRSLLIIDTVRMIAARVGTTYPVADVGRRTEEQGMGGEDGDS